MKKGLERIIDGSVIQFLRVLYLGKSMEDTDDTLRMKGILGGIVERDCNMFLLSIDGYDMRTIGKFFNVSAMTVSRAVTKIKGLLR